MENNEFGVKHPHESDGGCGCNCNKDENANSIVMCILANMKLNNRVLMLEKELEKIKEKTEKPKIVTFEIYKNHIDLLKPDDMTEDEIMQVLNEVLIQYEDRYINEDIY